MKCPKCGANIKEGAKFCGKCGKKLSLICPNCDSENTSGNNFCEECGHNLTIPLEPTSKGLSPEEKVEKIQKYLPKGIAEKILSQREKIEGERKQVTVMFCDMKGFTGLSEKIDPEEVYSIMDQVYEILIHKVRDYEGTVNEMTGDGIMALFGAPIALEDAPQRAIRSAYSIHREMARFNDKMKQEKRGLPPLKMRVGIHTGPVVVGTLGNDLRVEFKAVGDTVNLASRMEGLAEPGSTFLTEDTFRLTEGLFRFEALGEKEVKGKEEPVQAYRVIAPSTSRTRFDVSAERGLTTFVGRDRELELLLDGFDRSKAGMGQAFSIMSEAGVGKSRLLYEFRKAVTNEDMTFIEGKCLSYSRGVTYHPVIDIVKANFDIAEGDGDSEIREKLKQGLIILGADEASTLPYLLEFLSVKDSGVNPIALSPEARKDRTIKALIRITIMASEIRPLVLAIEDLHWIDKSSEDYFKDLLNSISGSRVFIIFTYRPEFEKAWVTKSYHSQVNLNRLSNRESIAMVTHILGTDNIDNELMDLILTKTEGVPFFIEELIKSLRLLKIIEKKDNTYHLEKDIKDVTIPSTIQDVIMARVDMLSEGVKELLQIGSVVEREFSYDLIKQVTGLPEQDLLSRLAVLKDAELLYERGVYPESTYIFKHALTKEVVYDSILSRKKKELHNTIGNAIEQLYNDSLHEYYGILAEHFISGEDFENGAKYCRLAGRKAEKASSFPDAITFGYKEVACLERLRQTDEVEKNLINTRTKIGLYYIQWGYLAKAKAVVDPITDLALNRNYKKRISQIYCILGAYNFYVDEDLLKGLDYYKKALKIGEESKNLPSLMLSNGMIGICLFHMCDFAKVPQYANKALEINVAANVPWGISAMKAYIAIFYVFHGKINNAYDTSDEASRIADESGDVYSKAHSYNAHGWSLYCKGYLKDAEEYLLRVVEIPESINHIPSNGWANFLLGKYYFDIQEYEKSKKHYEKAISVFQNASMFPSWVNYWKILLTLAKVRNNEKDVNLNEIFKYYNDNKLMALEGWMLHGIGRILLNIDDQHIFEAEDWIKKAIEADERNDTIWDLGQDYALYAEFFKRKGDPSKARENLNKAIEIFKECGADGWVKRYEKTLASLS
ncbi:adenylate/guanylate cyclase domain-containing protein [Thermodesulfobacteriota bacterium]